MGTFFASLRRHYRSFLFERTNSNSGRKPTEKLITYNDPVSHCQVAFAKRSDKLSGTKVAAIFFRFKSMAIGCFEFLFRPAVRA
jgi:hypothetical protein